MNKIKIYCSNDNTSHEVEMGTSLLELCRDYRSENGYPFLAAYVNNRIKELNYKVYTPITIRFIDVTQFEGYRVYQRTLSFIMQAAAEKVYPDRKFYIRHSLGNGLYCEVEGEHEFSVEMCAALKAEAQRLIDANLEITRCRLLTEETLKELEARGYDDKIALLKSRPHLYSTLYRMNGNIGYFYGALAPSTGYIHLLDVRPCYNGFYLAMPERLHPERIDRTPHMDKISDVFHEYQSWVKIMGVPTVGCLNAKVAAGDSSELIKIAEAFHEKAIARIADMIYAANMQRGVKMVLISGPSSSGKTTSAKRLGIQLRVSGLKPVLISLDDYFVEREKTPRDAAGNYDYEALEAIDLKQLNEHLRLLKEGQSVEIPRYDFITGTRHWHHEPLQLDERSILIMEGIHGLNPRLTPSIPDAEKFKIYISCFTSVAMDNLSRIPTTDNRLLRRLTRDYATRGNNGYATISRWGSVRRGEEKHIFPYQENADVMFNSSLLYEISVLRPFVEPILREVPDTVPEYGEAHRLLKFLDNFTPIDAKEIPPTSILREFIGGSSFNY